MDTLIQLASQTAITGVICLCVITVIEYAARRFVRPGNVENHYHHGNENDVSHQIAGIAQWFKITKLGQRVSDTEYTVYTKTASGRLVPINVVMTDDGLCLVESDGSIDPSEGSHRYAMSIVIYSRAGKHLEANNG